MYTVRPTYLRSLADPRGQHTCPQTSDERFLSCKNRLQDKLINSSGCANAEKLSALTGFAPDPLTRGSASVPRWGSAPEPTVRPISSRSALAMCPKVWPGSASGYKCSAFMAISMHIKHQFMPIQIAFFTTMPVKLFMDSDYVVFTKTAAFSS